MKLKVSYLKWRDGKPRWEPGPRLRKAGFCGRDLKDDSGDWLTLERAIERAKALNAEVAAWRAGGTPVVHAPKKPVAGGRCCKRLYELWIETPEFKMLRPSTQADYKYKAKAFLETPIDDKIVFADVHVAAISRKHLKHLWREFVQQRGLTMATATLRVVRIMMTFAVDEEWVKISPAYKLKLKTPPPRQVLWLPEEAAHFVATADRMRLHGVADAFVTALHTGQRQADVLSLPDRICTETRVRLSQLKSGGKAKIDAPMTPALLERVAKIRARRADKRAAERVTHLDGPMIVRDDTGAPYDKFFFNKRFREVRDEAMKEYPAIATKTFQDLRDTAVTRLALADCSMAEISSITGHGLEGITTIMKHYLVLQPDMADAAIRKLNAWMSSEGIAI